MKKFSIFVVALFALFVGCENPTESQFELPEATVTELTSLSKFTVPTTGDGGPIMVDQGVTFCGTPKVVDLFAGQNIDAGSVTIYNDNTNLYVTVFSEDGYQLVQENIKMWIGADLLTLPRNGQGVPINGQFPYKVSVLGTTHTFVIPLNSLSLVNACGDNIFVVVHADVFVIDDVTGTASEETAFGGNNGGDTGNRWWYYADYTIQCCDGGPNPFDNEGTAFAKGSHVFTKGPKSNPEGLPSLNLTKNRWGWAINLTEIGTTTYPIYAGAGLNDISKGTLVGELTVEWDGLNVSVSYDLGTLGLIKEVHVYAGDNAPTTIAPGQYGFTAYIDEPYESSFTTTLPLEDVNGSGVWIVAHSVVIY